MSIRIEYANISDLKIIRALSLKIWPVAYVEILKPDQIEYMLNQMYSISSLERQIESGHRFMIAYNNNEAVGFTSVSIASNGTSKLHKLYVVNELQGTGLGRLLLNKAIEYAILNKAYCITLNVNRYNKAIGFYTKAGFKIKETVDIDIGNGFFMNDYVMEMRL